MAGERSYSILGTKIADLTAACNDRLEDSEALFVASRHAAAVAAGLYALEIFLKIRICKKLDLDSLPRAFETHDLDGLLTLCGLSRKMSSQKVRGGRMRQNWERVRELSKRLNDYRYLPDAQTSREMAASFFEQLHDPQDGVLTWLRKQR